MLSAPGLIDLNELSLNQYSVDPRQKENQDNVREADQKLMLKLVQSIRRENSELSLDLLKDSGHRKIFEKWNEICSLAELEQIANTKRPDKIQLAKMLAIELQILRPSTVGLHQKRTVRSWGDLAAKPSSTLGVLPTFKNVTRFNPNRCVLRNGNWELP